MKNFLHEFFDDYKEELKCGMAFFLLSILVLFLVMAIICCQWFEQKLKQDTERTKNEIKLEKRNKE